MESGRGGLPEVSAQLFHFYKNDILENWSLKRGGRLWRLDCKRTSREYALVHYVFNHLIIRLSKIRSLEFTRWRFT